MFERPGLDTRALDERVDVGLLQTDDAAELVRRELTIAVLIMALLGAAMWAAFRGIFDGASGRAGNAVDTIGG